ncbi:metallophosphoesterase 1 isoform X2 [Manduca sexta]|uniref:metallophosphoesterase 1 isoform X2 n=1 Tax=Manduca sexta TaxID=7130 RepID=UPI0018905417|nr:metallophosphoesterase 1 isoform X2 [Manduca sexta]
MRRITKNVLLFMFGCICIALYCEFGIYYVVIAQCSWPELLGGSEETTLKAFMLADTHLLGPWRGHWLDKMRREWQMNRAFQTIVHVHRPEIIFLLGDLFDEGEWTNRDQFEDYVTRFRKLFAVPEDIKLYVTVGNHDIGFHNNIRRGSIERFNKAFNTTSVQLVTIKGNHFVLINSMAMEGDYCSLCTDARSRIESISEILQCSENPTKCTSKSKKYIKRNKHNYSRPILLQHFPLFRKSDAVCTEPDAPPLPERNKPFRLKIDALSKDATDYLVSKLKPRAVFGGHTHHGCLLHHNYKLSDSIEFSEYSIPSFSWRNRPDPKYMLVKISPENYAVNKCELPKETTIAFTAIVSLILFSCYLVRRRHIDDLF